LGTTMRDPSMHTLVSSAMDQADGGAAIVDFKSNLDLTAANTMEAVRGIIAVMGKHIPEEVGEMFAWKTLVDSMKDDKIAEALFAKCTESFASSETGCVWLYVNFAETDNAKGKYLVGVYYLIAATPLQKHTVLAAMIKDNVFVQDQGVLGLPHPQ